MKEERENLIQDNKIENNKKEKNEKQGRGLFYFVIAFAVIIIAIVGATYAYFTASTRTDEDNSITTSSTSLNLKIETDSSHSNYDLIPAADNIAKYAYAMQTTETEDKSRCAEYEKDDMGQNTDNCIRYKKTAGSTCIDQEGQTVCSPYSFTVTNDNVNPQTLTMYLGVTKNEFKNLWYAVYTDVVTGTSEEPKTTRTRITEPKAVPLDNQTESKIEPIVVDGNEEQTTFFKNLAYPTLDSKTPSKTFTIVLWIHETNENQTETDGSGKVFRGYVRVTSGEGDKGVTGILDAAVDYDDTVATSTTTSTTTPEPTSEATSTPGE